jgi:hypothetical protein
LPGLIHNRTSTGLGASGHLLPIEETHPIVLQELRASPRKPVIVVAAAGIGKTTLLSQLVKVGRDIGDNVFRCAAADLEALQQQDLEDSVRFWASLGALEATPRAVSLVVDGLDEVSTNDRTGFVQILARPGQVPNLQTIVSVRDAVWREESAWREKLAGWNCIQLEPWESSTVKTALSDTAFAHVLSENLLDLLRTPILLDLFWRTFLDENTSNAAGQLQQIQTRHGVLAAFWQNRLLDGPRRGSLRRPEIQAGLRSVSENCSRGLGLFPEYGLDPGIVSFLVSEAVLVHHGGLPNRLRFRHPLIRDFTFAQYCLAVSDVAGVVQRWEAIQSRLLREGCLRAILEALADPQALGTYPSLSLHDFIGNLCRTEPLSAPIFGRCLGMLKPTQSLDPGLLRFRSKIEGE